MSDVNTQIAHAPMPTGKTLKLRTSLPFQLWRFLWINLRIYRMVIKEHQAR
ncbi:MAG TPA: hypothetical protein VFP72_18010 [Kineosporiaceae bacterium]|nr:hypothetical protein [Kineosporiaceae bacterium]